MYFNGNDVTKASDRTISSSLICFIAKRMNSKKRQVTFNAPRRGKDIIVLQWMKHYKLDEAINIIEEKIAEKNHRYAATHKRYLSILKKVKKGMV